ncbi:nif-specific transcriptional activator NifA [Azotobacter chroococcum]|jgi:Nif-specific regulatory protein|uniref:Nif-specific regulatory protein n=2 Tax=Azotobacter chroococcum TaxID=353 RepID=A0A0C4WRR3_9GAMM|nr:nif-specific transcriptional activator NifA [Azotobacter chroococcum]AJE23329.1 Nif-specific sigma54-dependent transcriptional activator protein, NifA [Azotobacter chroococcum NCIMB 8003]NHN77005.1 nif-specific transcriptional activator NifA [Azotobacter chroococcum]TBV93475.1 nif-specific transcriptional activator NifA [Azotobacter chroococcum]TBW10089.1 nif-specific transcriptional activator NifA [Azotobacter chroococcum]TBW10791.1 nif-specific transcriptional activator NifA [Azotobacter 
MNAPIPQRSAKQTQVELYDLQLQALASIARTLSREQQIDELLDQVLAVLHNDLGLLHGLVTISDPEHSALQIGAIHTDSEAVAQACEGVRYRSGEGVIGNVLKHGNSVVLGRISADPRFLDRLALYDLEMPFIAVPIKNPEGNTIGVLAAQPDCRADEQMPARTRFLEIVANLLAQTVRLVVNIEDGREAADERDELRREVRGKYGFENMVVGHTPTMRRVFDQIRRVAKWNSTVLVLGESGTGKELIASAIHYNSPRAHRPFVRLNCAALPETLLESELFGHEKGAFTGAVKQRKGRFEQADGGTLFLDEIGEISPMFQAKLLRVLQEGEFERVGGNQTVRVNVRIVAATNRDLESEVEKGKFREDLYYRLNVMAIRIPPLRERTADIPELAEFLLTKIGRQQGRPLTVTDSAIRLLMSHRWPGNVRELENCLERSAIMSEDGTITRDVVSLTGVDNESPPLAAPLPEVNLADENLDDRERVIAALEQAGWVQAKAARLLGMTPRQIAYRIQTLNIHMRKI